MNPKKDAYSRLFEQNGVSATVIDNTGAPLDGQSTTNVGNGIPTFSFEVPSVDYNLAPFPSSGPSPAFGSFQIVFYTTAYQYLFTSPVSGTTASDGSWVLSTQVDLPYHVSQLIGRTIDVYTFKPSQLFWNTVLAELVQQVGRLRFDGMLRW